MPESTSMSDIAAMVARIKVELEATAYAYGRIDQWMDHGAGSNTSGLPCLHSAVFAQYAADNLIPMDAFGKHWKLALQAAIDNGGAGLINGGVS